MSRLTLTVLSLFLLFPVKAQQFLSLSGEVMGNEEYRVISDFQQAYLNTLYVKRVNIADELINGREYIPYYFKCKVKPLLFDQRKRSGSLLFNGRRYDHLKLEYDTFLDQLVYSDSSKLVDDKLFEIALNKDPVEGFSLYFDNDSMTFRHFRTGRQDNFNLPDGFYEVVYDGKSKYIIRHQSFPVEKDGLYEYRYTPSLFVSTGEVFSRFRSTGSFIKLFGKYSDQVRKYMRANQIRVRYAGKSEMSAVLRYYDTLVSLKK